MESPRRTGPSASAIRWVGPLMLRDTVRADECRRWRAMRDLDAVDEEDRGGDPQLLYWNQT